MKKQFSFLILSMLITGTFFSCTSKTVKTEERDLINKYFLTNDSTKGALSLDIEVEIPTEFVDSTVLKKIRSTIISNLFGPEYVHFKNDTVVKLFATNLIIDYKNNNLDLVNQLDSTSRYSFNNEHTVSGFSLLSDKKIYAYGIERYVFMGGAHGLETRNYYNFDLKTGNVINENDLFLANYKSKLSELIKDRIVEQSKEIKGENNSQTIQNLDETDFWTDSIKPNGNFYITDESINYVFNPYEIAPYFMGQTEVTLPYNRLKELLKPNSAITYLVEKQEKQAK